MMQHQVDPSLEAGIILGFMFICILGSYITWGKK